MQPDPALHTEIIDYCGAEWAQYETLCCDAAQVVSLKENMIVAEQILGQCPACWKNFKVPYPFVPLLPD